MTFDPEDPDLAHEFRVLVVYLVVSSGFLAGVVLLAFAFLGEQP